MPALEPGADTALLHQHPETLGRHHKTIRGRQPQTVGHFAQIRHLSAGQLGLRSRQRGEVQYQIASGGFGGFLHQHAHRGCDSVEGFTQGSIAIARNAVDALHHGINVGHEPHDLALHEGPVHEFTAAKLLIESAEVFQEAVVGRQELAELGVIKPEPGDLGGLVHVLTAE